MLAGAIIGAARGIAGSLQAVYGGLARAIQAKVDEAPAGESGEDAADEAIRNLQELRETEAAFDSLNNALSKSGEKSSPEGYNQDQRQELDRLIDDVGEPRKTAE